MTGILEFIYDPVTLQATVNIQRLNIFAFTSYGQVNTYLFPVPASTDYFLLEAQLGKSFTGVTPTSSTYNRGVI